MTPRILIVGGGPAGLTAAIAAARAGASVAVADRMDRVGKKLLASGGGRCNLSNISINESNYHGAGVKSAFSIIEKSGGHFATDFFKSIGVLTVLEDQTRYYPATFSSNTVLNALRTEAARLGVAEMCAHEAVSINVKNGVFTTEFRDRPAYGSDRVVVAAGGKASPALGSNGSGYCLLTALGHSLVASAPALTQLRLAATDIRGLQGVRIRAGLKLLRNCQKDSRAEGGVRFHETGELLFTNYGITGIPALNLSCAIAEDISAAAAIEGTSVISLDLFPDFTGGELCGFFEYQINNRPRISLETILCGVLNKRIASLVIKRAFGGGWAPGGAPAASNPDIANLARLLKDWRHTVTGLEGFKGAQATYGGIPLGEFCADTLESVIIPGLYAAGEILDVVGECGGYNLHWAWVSGYLAGRSAAMR